MLLAPHHDRPLTAQPAALAGLSLSVLLPSLATSVANVALPTFAEAFDAPFQHVQWIVLAYLLAVTALVVSAGRLGDIFGRKRLLLVGIGVFSAASILCAAAPNLGILLAARSVQGGGAALMLTLAMALASATTSKQDIGAVMGLLGAMSAIGTALGPALGGLMIHALGWRAIFFFSAPFAMLAMVLSLRYLPDDEGVRAFRSSAFDGLGTALLAIAIGAYALAMTTGNGVVGAINLVMLGVAALTLALFITVQMNSTSPLIRLSLFGVARLRAGLAANLLVTAIMMATLVVGPFYLSSGLGLDTRLVGIVMSVGPVVAALAGVPAGRFVDRLGPGRSAVIGLIGLTLGAIALAAIPATLGIAGYAAPIAAITAAYALFQAANTAGLLADADAEERGLVSALLTLSRNLGLITGASVLGAVFASASGLSRVHTLDAATAALGLRVTFAVAAGLALVGILLLTVGSRARRATAPS